MYLFVILTSVCISIDVDIVFNYKIPSFDSCNVTANHFYQISFEIYNEPTPTIILRYARVKLQNNNNKKKERKKKEKNKFHEIITLIGTSILFFSIFN